MKRKLIYIMLIINAISSLLMATVFAWFTIQDGGEQEYNAYFNSRRLIEAQMSSIVYRQSGGGYSATEVNYNSVNFYNKETYTLKIGAISANTTNNPHPLSINLNIKPFMDIYFRVFILESWTNSSGHIIEPPVNLTYVTSSGFTYNSDDGSYEYNDKLVMSDNFNSINFISGITTPTGAALADDYNFEIAVYIEAKQANVGLNWGLNEYEIDPVQISNLNMVFQSITNPYYLRGVGVKLIHGDNPNNTRTFIYNSSTKDNIINGFGSSINPHKLIIYLPLTMDFDITVKTDNNELEIITKYRKVSSFIGVHDFIYSPSVITSYVSGTTYPKGSIVFYNGKYYIVVQDNSSNTAPTSAWHWRPLGSIFSSNTQYSKGAVVYNDQNDTYYVKLTNDHNNDLNQTYHWKPVSTSYAGSINYQIGELVTYTDSGITEVYMKAESGSSGVPSGSKWHWKIIRESIDFIPNNKYLLNDIVYYNNNYYRSTNNNNQAVPPASSSGNGWTLLTQNVWSSQSTYSSNQLVIHDDKPYIWIGANNTNNTPTPGTSTNWRPVTNNWHPYKIYQVGENVFHNGRIYIYNGQGANNNLEPNTGPGWSIFGIDWNQYNTYYENDVVIHNGSVWRSMRDTPTSPPGLDFTDWEEIRLDWLPDRDITPKI